MRKPLGCVFLVVIWCFVVMKCWKFGTWLKILKFSRLLKLGKDAGSIKQNVFYGKIIFSAFMKSVMIKTSVLKWNNWLLNILMKRSLLLFTHPTSKNTQSVFTTVKFICFMPILVNLSWNFMDINYPLLHLISVLTMEFWSVRVLIRISDFGI